MSFVAEKWGVVELDVATALDSWIDTGVNATFTNGTTTVTVTGFGVADGTVRVRFSPPDAGGWSYEIATDGDPIRGSVTVGPASSRGPVRVDGRHFAYADGSVYTPFGTTLYAWAHQPEPVRAETLRTLTAAPFNKARMCVFPKGMIYNLEDPELFPFERTESGDWDVHRPAAAFWDAFDERLRELDRLGIEADLILFHPYDRWGLSTLSVEDSLAYVRYCVRRFSAFRNVWWSLANEHDLIFHRDTAFWLSVGELIAAEDVAGHLTGIHNWIAEWDASLPWVTHASIQTPDVHRVPKWLERYGKPVVIDECGYEGDLAQGWGHLSGFELVHRFWTVVAAGGYATHGETFHRENDLIWWAKGGRLRGDAVARIAYLRDLVDQLGPFDARLVPVHVDPNGVDGTFVQKLLDAIQDAGEIIRDRIEGELHFVETTAGNDVVLRYLGRSRQNALDWVLPEGEYRIDLIDAWGMTRRTVIPSAIGAISIPLPGVEATAVIATRITAA